MKRFSFGVRAATVAVGLLLVSVFAGSCSDSSTFTVSTSLSAAAARANWRGCTPSTCAGSPSSLAIKLYEAYVSANADCTNPVQIADHGTAGTTINIGTDNLIQSSPANGSYKCLILVMSDNLTFIPDATAVAAYPGVCQSNTSSTFDVYRTDSGDTWKDMDGNNITATGAGVTPGDDRVVVFATTSASALAASALAPHSNQTLTLTSELTVPGQTTFYVDFSDGITSSSGVCKIEDGAGMGFR